MEPYRQSEREFYKYLAEKGMPISQFLCNMLDGRNTGDNNLLAILSRVRQQAVQAKLEAAVEWIEGFLESGEKLIVFAHHREPIHALQEHFGNLAVSFTGEDKLEDRDAAVKAFQSNPDVKLIIISIRAGGIGITLTAASNVAFLESDWSPGINEQAEDRAHRIGQDADPLHGLRTQRGGFVGRRSEHLAHAGDGRRLRTDDRDQRRPHLGLGNLIAAVDEHLLNGHLSAGADRTRKALGVGADVL